MDDWLADLRHALRQYRGMAEPRDGQLDDPEFFRRPAEHVNPVALIVKHMAGNLASRWSDFLATDGEKPSRDRDAEFVVGDEDTREGLMAAWGAAGDLFFDTLDALTDADLPATVTIRGEAHRCARPCSAGCPTRPTTPGRSSTWSGSSGPTPTG